MWCQCHHHCVRLHFKLRTSFRLLCYRRGWMDMKICYFPEKVRSSKIYSGWSGNPEILKQYELGECVGSENVLHYAARNWKHNSTAAVVVNFEYSLESCETPTRFRQTQSKHNACIEAMYIISCQHISGRKSIWNNRSLEVFSILSSTRGSRWIWLYKCRDWPATTTTTHSKLDGIVCLLEGVKINMHCRVTLKTEHSQRSFAYICWSSRSFGT